MPIFDESIGRGIPDGVNTLIYTIFKHFVGTPSNVSSRISNYLNNLRCPTMSDYRWYQDVFISRVMLRKDSTKPYWKEKFIGGLPPIFAHKVRQELIGKNDSINYDNLTYGDIFSTIKKLGINMCNDEKMLRQQLKNKKKVKYKMGNFWEQYGLPPIAPSRQKKKSKHDKVYKDYNHKKHKRNRTKFAKPNDFNAKNKSTFKRHDKQRSDCNQKPGKLKNKLNMLNINDDDQNELFQILESTVLTDSFEEDFSSSSDSTYHSCSDTSSSPNVKIGCRDSCCNTMKSVNVLTKDVEQEDLLVTLISQIENPVLKQEYLDKFKKNLTRNNNVKKVKSKISLEETLERFNKKKPKHLTVNDLQHEITAIKQDIINLKNEFKTVKSDNANLKQELLFLKIDKNLDKHLSYNEHDEQEDGDESTQPPSGNVSGNALLDNQLALVKHILPPKWFTKVKIVVSHDYHFNTIAMIDSGADMNYIQEGLIPSKYFKKSTERLVSANGSQMKIQYKLHNAHVFHENVCFKIPSVLVKNMSDKVILGLPSINALYPFLVEHDGITTDPFRQKLKFKFASKFEIDTDDALSLIHAKVKHLNFLKQEVRYKRIAEQLSNNLLQSKIDNF
ncbi:hypothetical protein ACB092_06G081500 [Castanea dentata]